MPIVKLTFSGAAVDRAATAAAIRAVMHDVLAIPTSDGPVLFFDLPADAFQMPPGSSASRVFVEAVLFPGRTPETKGKLIAGLTAVVAEHFRVAPTDILLTISEPPLDNWGIRGGQQASQVVLGFHLDR